MIFRARTEVLFNRSVPIENALYSVSCTAEQSLNPLTVTADNISVYNADGQAETVEKVVYEPLSNQLSLVLSPNLVYNKYTVKLSDEVKTVSGTSAATNFGTAVQVGYADGIDGISVTDVAFYANGKRLSRPVSYVPVTARITLTNTTAAAQQKQLTVYVKGDAAHPLISSAVTLKAADTTVLAFNLPTREYSASDVVLVSLQS